VILFLARTGCQWRYLPAAYPPWEAVWQQWRRWRENGVWARAMARIARRVRRQSKRKTVEPTMVRIDAQTVRGGRAGPTFHNAGGRGGRTIGAKRSILIEYLGLPLAVRVDPARPHDVKVGRELLANRLDELPLVRDVIADRGYRGLAALAARRHLGLHIKAPPKGSTGFVPLAPLYKVEHTFARLGRWRLLRGNRGERPRLARSGVRRLPLRAAARRADLTLLSRAGECDRVRGRGGAVAAGDADAAPVDRIDHPEVRAVAEDQDLRVVGPTV